MEGWPPPPPACLAAASTRSSTELSTSSGSVQRSMATAISSSRSCTAAGPVGAPATRRWSCGCRFGGAGGGGVRGGAVHRAAPNAARRQCSTAIRCALTYPNQPWHASTTIASQHARSVPLAAGSAHRAVSAGRRPCPAPGGAARPPGRADPPTARPPQWRDGRAPGRRRPTRPCSSSRSDREGRSIQCSHLLQRAEAACVREAQRRHRTAQLLNSSPSQPNPPVAPGRQHA